MGEQPTFVVTSEELEAIRDNASERAEDLEWQLARARQELRELKTTLAAAVAREEAALAALVRADRATSSPVRPPSPPSPPERAPTQRGTAQARPVTVPVAHATRPYLPRYDSAPPGNDDFTQIPGGHRAKTQPLVLASRPPATAPRTARGTATPTPASGVRLAEGSAPKRTPTAHTPNAPGPRPAARGAARIPLPPLPVPRTHS
jgi:hypothetical protein